MKAFSILFLNLCLFQLVNAQVTYQSFDKEAKRLWNEGFRPIHDFDPSLLDQMARTEDMSKAKGGSGNFLFTLVSGRSDEFKDLKKAEIAAYIRAMEEFLIISQENNVTNDSDDTQNTVDSPYGKSLTQSSSYVDDGKVFKTYSSIIEFTHQMLLRASIQVDENQNKQTEFNLVHRGFPLFGTERIVNIYRKTENGKYEAVCFLAIDNYWLENQSLEFSGED